MQVAVKPCTIRVLRHPSAQHLSKTGGFALEVILWMSRGFLVGRAVSGDGLLVRSCSISLRAILAHEKGVILVVRNHCSPDSAVVLRLPCMSLCIFYILGLSAAWIIVKGISPGSI